MRFDLAMVRSCASAIVLAMSSREMNFLFSSSSTAGVAFFLGVVFLTSSFHNGNVEPKQRTDGKVTKDDRRQIICVASLDIILFVVLLSSFQLPWMLWMIKCQERQWRRRLNEWEVKRSLSFLSLENLQPANTLLSAFCPFGSRVLWKQRVVCQSKNVTRTHNKSCCMNERLGDGCGVSIIIIGKVVMCCWKPATRRLLYYLFVTKVDNQA